MRIPKLLLVIGFTFIAVVRSDSRLFVANAAIFRKKVLHVKLLGTTKFIMKEFLSNIVVDC